MLTGLYPKLKTKTAPLKFTHQLVCLCLNKSSLSLLLNRLTLTGKSYVFSSKSRTIPLNVDSFIGILSFLLPSKLDNNCRNHF